MNGSSVALYGEDHCALIYFPLGIHAVWVALVSELSSALGLEIISTTFLLFSESFGTSYSSSEHTTEVNLAPSFVLDGSVFIS